MAWISALLFGAKARRAHCFAKLGRILSGGRARLPVIKGFSGKYSRLQQANFSRGVKDNGFTGTTVTAGWVS
jgi:hypothetical protein